MSQPVIVLLVEDNSTHAHLITRHLEKTTDVVLSLHHQESLIGAFEFLSQHACDAVLLDLSLPDSEIRDTLPRFFGAHADIPVIVLTSLDDIETALLKSAVQRAGGNLSAAARTLGITRPQLVYRLKSRGLRV